LIVCNQPNNITQKHYIFKDILS